MKAPNAQNRFEQPVATVILHQGVHAVFRGLKRKGARL